MNIRVELLSVLLIIGMLMTSCYEKPEAKFYAPGVYQGSTDPLLARQASPEQQQRLQERIGLVQMDR